MEFNCIEECSQCCVDREYYPSKRFGKIGVLILPDEKPRIEKMAKKLQLGITILPRIGVSENDKNEPSGILAYQLMGKEENGNTCPFLDTKSGKRSPHRGYPCMIYENRPLACQAYPVIDSGPIILDNKCKFCKHHGQTSKNLNSEVESLIKIKSKMKTPHKKVWRYATGIGEKLDKDSIESGWIQES
ncbi:MAG: YkgJ family cysteine cluster protein [Nitrosopumilaceae archaeon]|nr:YkgJ family cysteine cluster protein [Nitrosopumilaceae archaeon]NIU00316.1 YkgJ family cysteine cluster protein [Nitrosopumilaceae archaeon]NIU86718.1 YkgJ family cysteine cluster protein [Nitrosopumilaceae archaeon]NIV65419.1 YkgJ family cysteine cluster protein [Nitrosopumilaceae archaeon]NIX60918.1 YkgJ family cysteine cluster protein [Nitrosopumilaceae archaeon]